VALNVRISGKAWIAQTRDTVALQRGLVSTRNDAVVRANGIDTPYPQMP
jgi:hypothetical protein